MHNRPSNSLFSQQKHQNRASLFTIWIYLKWVFFKCNNYNNPDSVIMIKKVKKYLKMQKMSNIVEIVSYVSHNILYF